MTVDKSLTIESAAEILSCSARTIYRLLAEAEIIAFRLRGRLRITEASLDAYQRRQIAKFQQELEINS
jgi:excisionase family DNA binding protein